MPFWAPCAVIPVTDAPDRAPEQDAAPYWSTASGAGRRRAGRPCRRARAVDRSACAPAAGDVDAAQPVVAPALEPHAEAVSPDGPAQDRHAVHAPAGDADADVALGHRVPALDA